MPILQFLWLAIRPVSKLESAVGWWDVLNLALLIAYPTIGNVAPLAELFKEAPLAWFASIPILLLLIAGIKLQFKLARVEKEKEPQLTIEGVSTVNYGNVIGHIWRLKVKNKGTNLAEDCRGQLIELVDEMLQEHLSWERWPVNEYLEWGTGGGESIPISGHHTAELEIVTYGGIHTCGKYEEPLQLAYAKGKDFRSRYALKILRGGVIMLISIVSKNRLPIYAVCILHEYAEAHKNLELLAVTTNKPDIADYQRLDSHKEGSQA